MDNLIFTLAEENDLIFEIADDDQLDFELKEPSPESFHGEYIFTPTDEPQEIETAKNIWRKILLSSRSHQTMGISSGTAQYLKFIEERKRKNGRY